MQTLPTSVIRPFWFPPKVTTPLDIGLRDWNIDLLLVMCHEQPLSRYHDWCFFPAIEEICNKDYFSLWYPNLFGSFFLISFWVLVSTRGTLWWVVLFREVLAFMSLMTHLSTKIANNDFFTMHNLSAFETMTRFVSRVSLHLNNFVKGFMNTNKFA